MKLETNIKHNKPKTNEECPYRLYREDWGLNNKGGMDMNMTCMNCGFAEIISHDTFLKWQYLDKVIYE